MDPVWLHLLFNHIPIIATAFAVLVVFAALIIRNDVVRRTGLVLYVVAGLAIYPANFTGEPAEEKVEEIAGISHKQIHEHEEAAELAVTLTSIALFLALLHLFNRPSQVNFQRLVLTAFLIIAVAANIQAVITGHEGGLIRRPELGGLQDSSPPNNAKPHTDH